jgi:hypothetical protein
MSGPSTDGTVLRRRVGTLLCVCACIPLCAAAQVPALEPAPVADSVRDGVLEVLESYYDAFSDRDWERFAVHFWPGATITTVWQPPGEPAARVTVTTIPEFVRQAPEGPGSKEIFEERMIGVELHVRGTLAQAFARYRARFGDPGEIAEWEGTDSFSLLRHDGQWRILSLSFASEP